jgi:hypothetical protein
MPLDESVVHRLAYGLRSSIIANQFQKQFKQVSRIQKATEEQELKAEFSATDEAEGPDGSVTRKNVAASLVHQTG